jgi:hypothetical protein
MFNWCPETNSLTGPLFTTYSNQLATIAILAALVTVRDDADNGRALSAEPKLLANRRPKKTFASRTERETYTK